MAAGQKTFTVTGLSSTFGYNAATFFPDTSRNPFNIGFGCVVNSTNVTYNIEHTWDYNPTGASSAFTSSLANWFQHSSVTGASTNANSNYAFPVTAIRLNVTAGSSTGTVMASFVQAGIA